MLINRIKFILSVSNILARVLLLFAVCFLIVFAIVYRIVGEEKLDEFFDKFEGIIEKFNISMKNESNNNIYLDFLVMTIKVRFKSILSRFSK